MPPAARAHFPPRAVITVGDAIEVSAAWDRSQESDPITTITTEMRRQMSGRKAQKP